MSFSLDTTNSLRRTYFSRHCQGLHQIQISGRTEITCKHLSTNHDVNVGSTWKDWGKFGHWKDWTLSGPLWLSLMVKNRSKTLAISLGKERIIHYFLVIFLQSCINNHLVLIDSYVKQSCLEEEKNVGWIIPPTKLVKVPLGNVFLWSKSCNIICSKMCIIS